MQRRTSSPLRLAAATATVALALAACGDDSVEPVAEPGDSVPSPDTTTPSAGTDAPETEAFEHPMGADEVVVSITYEGGFMPVSGVFTQLPVLLVAGDGRAYTQGPQIEMYPGPLLPNVQVVDTGENGIQNLLDLAADHGLLTEREYESPTNVADAPDTVVTIRANGETYVHRAYALGIGGGIDGSAESGDRAELLAFVEVATSDLAADGEGFEPETYLVMATPVDDLSGYEIEPTVIDWPDDASLALADAADCAAVPADEVAELFTAANQLTLFVDAGVTYGLAVKPVLPADNC